MYTIPRLDQAGVVSTTDRSPVADRSAERLETIARDHPDYLYARTQLAVDALQADDVERAEALLRMPEGRRRFHVHEYAAFLGATGLLSLAKCEPDGARDTLATIAEVIGEDADAYRMLGQAITNHATSKHATSKHATTKHATKKHATNKKHATAKHATTKHVTRSANASKSDSERGSTSRASVLSPLPRLNEIWSLAVVPATFTHGEDDGLALTYAAAVARGDGFLRHMAVNTGPFDDDALYELMAAACRGGATGGVPGRPRAVHVADGVMALRLARLLAPAGIEVDVGDIEQAREPLTGFVAGMAEDDPESYLDDVPMHAFEAFLEAALSYLGSRPWDVFDADAFLAFRVDDGSWRYASVMGQGGEEFGLAVFESWSQAQQVAGADPALARGRSDPFGGGSDPFAGGEALESMSLSPLSMLAPRDAARFVDAGFEPDGELLVPVALRFTSDGITAPTVSLHVYVALLSLLARRSRRVRFRVRKITDEIATSVGRLQVRFPGTGEESRDNRR